MDDDSVDDLLEAAQRQDAQAFRRLYDRTAPKLLGIALRILKRREAAEDVVHDVFVKLWNGDAGFDKEIGSALAFLSIVTRNKALDTARRKTEILPGDEAELEDVMDLMPSPEAVAADRSDLKALLICLERLADGPRRAILYAYVDGSSGEEIATTMATPIGTIKSWIHRGLASVRECLGR